MKTIFDASSLLNLANGGLLGAIAGMPGIDLAFGPQVRSECRSLHSVLDEMVASGSATLVDDDDLPASRFLDLLARYDLGPGETECLTLAEHLGWRISCDDGRARRMIAREIGVERLTGSIGILHTIVRSGLMSEAEAASVHALMIANGGFLPAFVQLSRKSS